MFSVEFGGLRSVPEHSERQAGEGVGIAYIYMA